MDFDPIVKYTGLQTWSVKAAHASVASWEVLGVGGLESGRLYAEGFEPSREMLSVHCLCCASRGTPSVRVGSQVTMSLSLIVDMAINLRNFWLDYLAQNSLMHGVTAGTVIFFGLTKRLFMERRFCIFWVWFGLLSAGLFTQVAHAGEKGDAVAGKKIFATNCAPCHQANGEGKIGLAPSIRNRDFLALASDDFIRLAIVKGRVGTTMMARPDLKGKKVTDIIAYLRNLEVKNPIKVTVNPKFVAKGDVAKGKEGYKIYCSTCHGAKGEGYMSGGPGPGIGLKSFLDVASDDYIYKTLKIGRIGTAMRPFIGPTAVADLSDQEAYDIIVYLRSLVKK